MRYLWIAAALVAIVGIGSCAKDFAGAPAPEVTQGMPAHVLNAPAIARYVYVADRSAERLLVYPARTANPAPIRTVSFASQPIGVATDAAGNVYVTLYEANKVAVFSSGATKRVGTLTADVNSPSGVVVDAGGNLWVASRGNPSYVTEYTGSGSSRAETRVVDLPQNFVAAGIAVDRAGDLWADVMASQGGFVLEYPPAQNAPAQRIQVASAAEVRPLLSGPIIGTAGNGGVAFDGRGFLRVGTISNILTFAPPAWKRVDFAYYGQGTTLHQLTAGADGSLYVPIEVHGAAGYVLVVPSTAASAPYKITQGLTLPSGAAGGP